MTRAAFNLSRTVGLGLISEEEEEDEEEDEDEEDEDDSIFFALFIVFASFFPTPSVEGGREGGRGASFTESVLRRLMSERGVEACER